MGSDKVSESEDVPFKELSTPDKVKSILVVVIKLTFFLFCLYVFICSLGLLESAFQLLGGKTAGKAFSSGVLSNPLAGLMIGVLATVLMQSSSTSSSIVVAMVGSGVIPVEKAVPIIMGANIGTSVTNTIVSLAQAGNREEFRRAFSGATVHDMFNWLSVIVLLPIEVAFGFLSWLSKVIVASMGLTGNSKKPPDMLKAITKPVLNAIVKVNKDIISEVAQNSNNTDGTILKRWCRIDHVLVNRTVHRVTQGNVDCARVLAATTNNNNNSSPGGSGSGSSLLLRKMCGQIAADHNGSVAAGGLNVSLLWDDETSVLEEQYLERCPSLFAHTDLSEVAVGAILLVVSLFLMLAALMIIVKLLNSMLHGSMSRLIKTFINADLPGPFAYFTGYIAMLVGMGMTIVVQSSSIFTSTLTPLVGLGIVDIERMYPMTLGSNIGTTVTAMLAALSQSGDKLENSLRIAMCHLFFNISGLLLFYPIPFMRFPVGMAKVLGKTTAKHRWFAIFYIVLMFVLFPGLVFALSYAGWVYLACIGGPLFLLFLVVLLINAIQKKNPKLLPVKLQTWDFLPHWMHSLKPVDALIGKIFQCAYCQNLQKLSEDDDNDDDLVVNDNHQNNDNDDNDNVETENNNKNNGRAISKGDNPGYEHDEDIRLENGVVVNVEEENADEKEENQQNHQENTTTSSNNYRPTNYNDTRM